LEALKEERSLGKAFHSRLFKVFLKEIGDEITNFRIIWLGLGYNTLSTILYVHSRIVLKIPKFKFILLPGSLIKGSL